ncbi:uncharacterized protein LOC126967548 [Leptidea sinapis]|uniref:uncharacterized protein LOC126967548 n=1 Tax=Leptidea sinapis TaxID=189913 RepID=UPI0021C3F3D0|nr:uncharacterized protein LOC126967548 [Leptidea sinapis]
MLQNITQKYNSAQEQISEHIKQADCLIKLGNKNMECFESFINNNNNNNMCHCSSTTTFIRKLSRQNRQHSPNINVTAIDNHNIKLINIVHQNIQGFSSKELEIELFLSCCNIDILWITEHWRKSHQLQFSFREHKVVSSFCRSRAIHGGSLIIINNRLKCKNRRDIVNLSIEQLIEVACIELEQFIIVSVYRPPTASYEQFQHRMEEVLSKFSKTSKSIIVCGDFNINLLEPSANCTSLKNLFQSFNLFNVFWEPTRITSTTATCLDNIFTDVTVTSKLIINNLQSDHSGQLIKVNTRLDNVRPKKVKIIPVTGSRLERFRNNLVNTIPFLHCGETANFHYNLVFNSFCEEFDRIFTPVTVTVNNKHSFNDWATMGIHKSRKRLYDLYYEKHYNNSEEFKIYVKKYSKLFKIVCHEAKTRFIADKIKNSNNKVKATWSVINNETGRSNCRNTSICLNINNRVINSEIEIANEFDKYFSEIPIVTTKFLNSSPKAAYDMLKLHVPVSSTDLKFKYVSEVAI